VYIAPIPTGSGDWGFVNPEYRDLKINVVIAIPTHMFTTIFAVEMAAAAFTKRSVRYLFNTATWKGQGRLCFCLLQ